MATSQNQQNSDQQDTAQQAAAASARPQQRSIDVWTAGARLELDVGNGQYVLVPNLQGKEPTREGIYRALVAAGHHDRANELADRAYGDVSGTGGD